MRRFAEKLRISLHWKMHCFQKRMAIEQRNHGCPNEIGSFDAKHSPPAELGRNRPPADQPTLARCRTCNFPANSRNLSRVDARNRPSNRPPASFDIRTPQVSGVQPSLANTSATSAEIAALPSRSIRPVYSIQYKKGQAQQNKIKKKTGKKKAKNRHSNSVARKIAFVNVACFRYD